MRKFVWAVGLCCAWGSAALALEPLTLADAGRIQGGVCIIGGGAPQLYRKCVHSTTSCRTTTECFTSEADEVQAVSSGGQVIGFVFSADEAECPLILVGDCELDACDEMSCRERDDVIHGDCEVSPNPDNECGDAESWPCLTLDLWWGTLYGCSGFYAGTCSIFICGCMPTSIGPGGPEPLGAFLPSM